jgi:hypothetical protein
MPACPAGLLDRTGVVIFFVRLEFELFTKPSKSEFLRVYHISVSWIVVPLGYSRLSFMWGCNNSLDAYFICLVYTSIKILPNVA